MTKKALDMVNTDGNTALDYAIHNKLIITGVLAKKMSLEVVKTVNADCTTGYLEKITDYKNLTQYNETREHEKVIGKCFPLPVKLNLPPLSLEERAEWLAPALVGLGVVGLGTFFCYYFYNAYFKKNGNQLDSTNNLVKEEEKQVVTQTTSIIQEESIYKILKK